MKKIIIATSNKHKVAEFKLIFGELGIEVEGLPEGKFFSTPEEDGTTFEENADKKALHYSKELEDYVLADDSGLCVEGLQGEPGIFSSRYAGPKAKDGDNIRKLLEKMSPLQDRAARKAFFFCSLSLARKGIIIKRTWGKVSGSILKETLGVGGFGYDPIFYYKPLKATFAEIPDSGKNKISHRARASRKMARFVKTLERK